MTRENGAVWFMLRREVNPLGVQPFYRPPRSRGSAGSLEPSSYPSVQDSLVIVYRSFFIFNFGGCHLNGTTPFENDHKDGTRLERRLLVRYYCCQMLVFPMNNVK